MNSGKCYFKIGIIVFSKFVNEKVWVKFGLVDWLVDNKYCFYRGYKFCFQDLYRVIYKRIYNFSLFRFYRYMYIGIYSYVYIYINNNFFLKGKQW